MFHCEHEINVHIGLCTLDPKEAEFYVDLKALDT